MTSILTTFRQYPEDMSVPQLKAICKQLGVTGYMKLRRAQLVYIVAKIYDESRTLSPDDCLLYDLFNKAYPYCGHTSSNQALLADYVRELKTSKNTERIQYLKKIIATTH